MAQILDPIPNAQRIAILCCYVNATSQIQVVRITNVTNWYFERVVFPGQRLVFETLPQAVLEIHTGMMASSILSDTIPCDRLCIDDDDDFQIDEQSITVSLPNNKKTSIEMSDHHNHSKVSDLKPALV
ncbi:MAG TPA: hypothetical protein DCF68_22925 [Cyanothece sp. UBA12306]|nr:hypothetical protein [Cyanothece sp. UBA12306]